MPKAKYEGIYRSIKKRIEAQDYPYPVSYTHLCNYRIFYCNDELFGYYECEKGVAYAEKVQAESPVVDRWNAYMKDILEPVSYTHLDVYKRQFLHVAPPAALQCCSSPVIRRCSQREIAVSYTHLDVYKRQGRYNR